MYSNGIMGLNTPMDVGQNDAYPGSQQLSSQYATPNQSPMNALNTGYEPRTDAYGDQMMASGGIASIRRFAGEDGSQVEEPPSWNPEAGQVKLQTIPKQGDREGEAQITDYTIPKDHIKVFAAQTDPETGKFAGAAYTMKDGSTLGVDRNGIVQSATPSRNDYKLNEQGYYQPVGANLTWDGGLNQLTKKVGGIDVLVPGQFHKGGYQDDQGNLRVDESGVPVPLLPNYLDSGMGKSGLADAAPYITAAMLAAATMGASTPASAAMLGGEAAFTGMVPASETLLGSMGYLGSAAPTVSSTLASTAPTVASAAPTTGAITAIDAGTQAAINAAALPTYGSATLPYGITSVAPATSSTMIPNSLMTLGRTGASGGVGGGAAAGMNMYQKLALTGLASKALSGGSGGSSGGGSGTQVSTQSNAPTTTMTSTPTRAPTAQAPVFSFPTYNSNQNTGLAYNPYLFNYQTRNAAQGGLMYADGGIADLGGYAAGGKLLRGPGDGMSDSIEANIGGKQPARLADGEFVVPADVVSHLGNGSTDAGAKHLYKMMDNIRKARTGNPKQGKKINADKFLPRN